MFLVVNRSLRLFVLLTPAAALLAGCGSSSPSGGAADTAVLEKGASYVVEDYAFPPLTVSPGQAVDVVDQDEEPHTLTADDGSFDTGSFDNADPGRFIAPTTPGRYEFACSIHPSMTGTLTVR